MRASFDIHEVLILKSEGQENRFEVILHSFGHIPNGEARNGLAIEQRDFLDRAIACAARRMSRKERKLAHRPAPEGDKA